MGNWMGELWLDLRWAMVGPVQVKKGTKNVTRWYGKVAKWAMVRLVLAKKGMLMLHLIMRIRMKHKLCITHWWACSFGTDVYPSIFTFISLSLHCRYPSHATHHCNIPRDTCEPAQLLTHITLPLLAPLQIAPLDQLYVSNVHVIYRPHCYISLSWWVPTLFSDDIFLLWVTDSPPWYPTALLSYPTYPDTGQLVSSHCATWSSFLYLITCSFCTIQKNRREVYSENQENIMERRFHPSASVHSSLHLSESTHCVWLSTCSPDCSCSCFWSTWLLLLTHSLLLTPILLLTPWHPLNLLPTSLCLCATSDCTSDCLSTFACILHSSIQSCTCPALCSLILRLCFALLKLFSISLGDQHFPSDHTLRAS